MVLTFRMTVYCVCPRVYCPEHHQRTPAAQEPGQWGNGQPHVILHCARPNLTRLDASNGNARNATLYHLPLCILPCGVHSQTSSVIDYRTNNQASPWPWFLRSRPQPCMHCFLSTEVCSITAKTCLCASAFPHLLGHPMDLGATHDADRPTIRFCRWPYRSSGDDAVSKK